jgi:ketosteroid isomerase-like protein
LRETVEIVRAFYEARNAGDMDACCDLYDPAVIIFQGGLRGNPWGWGRVHGTHRESGFPAMELAGLEPATSWVRSKALTT